MAMMDHLRHGPIYTTHNTHIAASRLHYSSKYVILEYMDLGTHVLWLDRLCCSDCAHCPCGYHIFIP